MVQMQDSIGALLPGREADISVLDLLRGRFTLSDNSGEKVIAQEMLTPAFAIRAGRVVAADSALIPPPPCWRPRPWTAMKLSIIPFRRAAAFLRDLKQATFCAS